MRCSKTATFVKDVPGFTGKASLYALGTPIASYDWEGNKEKEYNFVIVSSTYAPFSGPETYIFPSDEKGTIISWGELEGSYRGGTSHYKALKNAGYEIKE